MTTLAVEAVYQHGIIKPLEPLELLEGEHLWVTVKPVQSVTAPTLAADDPCGAFPELDLGYEATESLTRSSWEPKFQRCTTG